MAPPMGAGIPPEQLLAMLGLGGPGGPGGPGAMGPMGPMGPGGPGPGGPGPGGPGFQDQAQPSPLESGVGSAISRMGFSTLPPIQEGQFGIPVGNMMVDPRFFMQMRNHMDAMDKTNPALRDQALLGQGPSMYRQGAMQEFNTPATGSVPGLGGFLGGY